jgi:DNA-binding FadR family transcriptional regulator
MKYTLDQSTELSTQIAEAIREAIVNGNLLVDERLPSEGELCDRFEVSRSTVREALKRLAAQNLIRTQRGAMGGAFVNRITFEDAYPQQITTSTLLLSMNEVSFETACEARFAVERACVPLSAKRCKPDHLATMRAEIHRQKQSGLSDESFCTSDVAFHKALVEGAGNPVLTYQLAGAIESMQPLMNMIIFSNRDRAKIIDLHTQIADAIENSDAELADAGLSELAEYTVTLADQVRHQRAARKKTANESQR